MLLNSHFDFKIVDSFVCSFYASQKKTLELNPGHPLVKELLKRVTAESKDKTAADLARVLFETATLRSGYVIKVSNYLAIWWHQQQVVSHYVTYSIEISCPVLAEAL